MPPFADLLQQLVAADGCAGAFGDRGQVEGGGDACRGRFEKATSVLEAAEQGGNAIKQLVIASADLL